MNRTFNVIVVADPRFSGGTTSALVSDVAAMAALNMNIGLVFVRSSYLDDARDRANPKALALADLNGVTLLNSGSARAKFAFLHHPLVFFRGIEERLDLTADRSVIVTHHAPFRADGSLEWDPIATRRRARARTGLAADFAPISGFVRAQMESFVPFIRLTGFDWTNIFDPADWPETRRILTDTVLTIGRHGRADPLKFPPTASEIDASLPVSDSVRARVLGCPTEALTAKGAHPERWETLDFGAEEVPDFLNTLDVFTYHYHPNLQEAFGRTVVEAILCGRPCLVDPRLEPTFGGMASYCSAAETASALLHLSNDPAGTRARASRARDAAVAAFGTDAMQGRIDALGRDVGVTLRHDATSSPLHTVRKLAGLYRRRARGLDG